MHDNATTRDTKPARLITLQTASAEYGVPYRSLFDLVRNGHLQSVRLADTRRIWIRREDMERFIDRSIIPADSIEPLTTRPVR